MAHPLSFSLALAVISLYFSIHKWSHVAKPAILLWGIDGEPVLHGPSIFPIIGIPILTYVIPYVLYLATAQDEALEHMSEPSKHAVRHVIWLPAFFLFILQAFYILDAETSSDHRLHIRGIVFQTAIWLFLWLGHNLSVVEPNSIIGFVTPWTISSFDVWTKTAERGGWVLFGSGIALAVFTLLQFSYSVTGLFFIIVAVSSWAIIWYDSYQSAHSYHDIEVN